MHEGDQNQQARKRSADRRGTPLEQLYKEAEQNELILRRYQSFELQMLSATDLEELLHTLLNTSVEFFKLETAELWLNDSQQTLEEFLPERFQEHANLQLIKRERSFERLFGEYRDTDDSPAVRLVSSRETYPLPVFKEQRVGSVALLPLYRKNHYVGSMHLGARSDKRFAADKSTDFVAHLASIVAVCIENALSQEHLRQLSVLDMLTRVKNRRGFDLALDREVSRASRSGDPVGLLFVDLDHFKSINDTYGHPMGDKVLRVVAQLFRDTLRKVDHVCRYGGEEFAIVMPNCGEGLAMDIAERLRQRVSELRVELEQENTADQDAIGVTVSMGVCCWQAERGHGDKDEAAIAQKLVALSDQGVYEAKESGRNRVRYVGFA